MWKRKTGGHVVSLTHITTPAGQDGQSWADSDGDASSETDESEGSVCTSPDTAPSSHTSTTASSSRGGWSRMSRALTRVAIGFPWAVLLWLIVVAVPVGLTYRYYLSPPRIVVSLQSFKIPDDPIGQLFDATRAADHNCDRACEYVFCTDTPHQQPSTRARRMQAVSSTAVHVRERRESLLTVSLVYRSKRGNMLTPSGMQLVHQIESELGRFAASRGETVVWRSTMLYVFPPTGEYGGTLVAPSMDQIQAGLNMAYNGTGGIPGLVYPPPVGDTIFEFGGNTMLRGVDGWTSQYVRTQMETSASTSTADVKAWVDKLRSANTAPSWCELTFAAPSIINYIILTLVHEDLFHAIYALAFVGICMLVHTNSILVSLFGVVNSVLAFPAGYAIYREVLGYNDLSVLSVCTVFVVLGIAVDDLFVFVDIWRQQDRSLSVDVRLHNTIRSAAASCLFTTVTSAAAFAANTISSIPALAQFGAFTACVIVAYFVLLFLLVFPTLVFWWRYVEQLEQKVARCVTWPFRALFSRVPQSRSANVTNVVTNPTFDVLSRGADAVDDKDDDARLLHLEVDFDESTPRTIAVGTWVTEPVADCANTPLAETVTIGPSHALAVDRGVPTVLERVLYSVVSRGIIACRRWILVAFAIFLSTAIYSTCQLEFSRTAPALVRADSDVGRVQALSGVFAGWSASGGSITVPSGPPRGPTEPPVSAGPTLAPTAHSKPTPPITWAPSAPTAPLPPVTPSDRVHASANADIEFVMGFAAPFVDRSNTDTSTFTQNFADYRVIFDPRFNDNASDYNATLRLGQAVAAQWRTVCLALLNTTIGQTALLTVPADTTAEDVCGCVDCVGGLKVTNCSTARNHHIYTALYTVSKLTSTFTANAGSVAIMEHYHSVRKQLNPLRHQNPAISSLQFTSEEYVRASFELAAIWGAIWGIMLSIMLCITAIVLFKPHGVVIAVAVGVMISIVFSVLATFSWSGWQLGGIEAVALSILVGTSVDFLIHMTEAFLLADPTRTSGLRDRQLFDAVEVTKAGATTNDNEARRHWRVQVAMASVGVPITWSAITTAGSAGFLMSCNLVLFRRLGEILVFNTLISWSFTMILLPALLATVGPPAFQWTLRRCARALFCLCLVVGIAFLVLYMAWQAHPRTLRNSQGESFL